MIIKQFLGHAIQDLKTPWKLYQKLCWYFSIGVNEYQKPLRLSNETMLIVLYLNSAGFKIGIMNLIILYAIIFVFGVVSGRIVVLSDTTKINTQWSNSQNPELTEILSIVRELKEHRISQISFEDCSHNHCYNKDGTCYGAYAPKGGCKVRCHDENNKNCWHYD